MPAVKRSKRGRETGSDSDSGAEKAAPATAKGKKAAPKKASAKKAPAKSTSKKAPAKKASAKTKHMKKKEDEDESTTSSSDADSEEDAQPTKSKPKPKGKKANPKASAATRKKLREESSDSNSSDDSASESREEEDATPRPTSKKGTNNNLKLAGQTKAGLAKLIQNKVPAVDWIGEYTASHSNPDMSIGFLKKEAMALTKFLSFYQGSRNDGLDAEGDVASQCPVALVSGPGGLARKLAIYYDRSGHSWYGVKVDLSKGWLMDKRSMVELAALGRADWFLGFIKDRMEHAANFKVPVLLPSSIDGAKISLRDHLALDAIGRPKHSNYKYEVQSFIRQLAAQGVVDIIRILLKFFLLPEISTGIESAIKVGSLQMCRLFLEEGEDDLVRQPDRILGYVKNTIQLSKGSNFAQFINCFIEDYGADLSQKIDNLTPIEYAAKLKKADAVKWFMSRGVKLPTDSCLEPLLVFNAGAHNLDELKYWLDQGGERQQVHHRSQEVLRKIFREALMTTNRETTLQQTKAAITILEFCLDQGMELSEEEFSKDAPLQQASHDFYSPVAKWEPMNCVVSSSPICQFTIGNWMIQHGYPMKNLELVLPWIDEAFEKKDIDAVTLFLRSIPEKAASGSGQAIWHRSGRSIPVQTGLTHLLCRAITFPDKERVRPLLIDLLLAIGADCSPIWKDTSRYASAHHGYGSQGYHWNPTFKSQSPLLLAIQRKELDLVKLFLERKGENIRSPCVIPIERSDGGSTLTVSHSYFHCAIRIKNEPVLKFFLDSNDYNIGGYPHWKGEHKPVEYTWESRPDFQTRSWYSKYSGYNEHTKCVGTKKVQVPKPKERWEDVPPFTLEDALNDTDGSGRPIFDETERVLYRSWLVEVGLLKGSSIFPSAAAPGSPKKAEVEPVQSSSAGTEGQSPGTADPGSKSLTE